MGEIKNCFVIIGYGKKTSYANGKSRVLDLDETYSILIKPVFDSLNIPCYRAIDKNLSGSIDKVMLEEIKNADLAVVDISTLNANVMWELGVRHSLKPSHTVMICEKEQMGAIPFDINHFVVHQYSHSEEGIPYKEVDRFRNHLTNLIKNIINLKEQVIDSPVFQFLPPDNNEPNSQKIELAANNDSFAIIMEKAESAKNKKDYESALILLEKAKGFAKQNMTLKDNLPLIICRQTLCTYKSKNPNEIEALLKAKIVLDELKPDDSNDLEVLGLSGSINKRLYELLKDETYLNNAIKYYEKGFLLKQDYYNGINAAFMIYKKASDLKTQKMDWEDIKLKADYIRNSVIETINQLESKEDFNKSKDLIWILLSKAEAYHYKGNEAAMKDYEDKAFNLAKQTKDDFALSSYQEQKNKIQPIMLNLKTI